MGASSRRYTPVPQSDEAALSPPLGRSAAAARDFKASVGDDDDEEEGGGFLFSRGSQRDSYWTTVKRGLFLAVLVTGTLALGFCAGSKHQQMKGCSSSSSSSKQQQLGEAGLAEGLLPPQSLLPDSTFFALSFLGEGRGFPRTIIFHVNSVLTSLPSSPPKKYPPRTSNSASPRLTKTRVSRATNYGMPSCRVRPYLYSFFFFPCFPSPWTGPLWLTFFSLLSFPIHPPFPLPHHFSLPTHLL